MLKVVPTELAGCNVVGVVLGSFVGNVLSSSARRLLITTTYLHCNLLLFSFKIKLFATKQSKLNCAHGHLPIPVEVLKLALVDAIGSLTAEVSDYLSLDPAGVFIYPFI